MKVKILTALPYADLSGNVRGYQPGEMLDTKDWYAKSLIDDGYAEPIIPEPLPESFISLGEKVDSSEGASSSEQFGGDVEPAFDFMSLPGMTEAIAAELAIRGIRDRDALVNVLTEGTAVNIQGVGIRKYQAWKKALGIYPKE